MYSHKWRRAEISVNFLLLIYIVMQIFDGPLRWFFASVGLSLLINARDVLLIFILISLVFSYINNNNGLLKPIKDRLEYKSIAILMTYSIVLSILMGYANNLSLLQILFGLKILLPFFASLFVYLSPQKNNGRLMHYSGILLFIVCLGLIINVRIIYPWSGFIYTIADVSIEGSRLWTINGTQRIAGFSRASFSAGIQIVVFLSMYIEGGNRTKNLVLRFLKLFLIITISGYSVYLTTSRSALLAYISLLLLFLFKRLYWKGFSFTLFLTKVYLFLLLVYGTVPIFISQLNPNLIVKLLEKVNPDYAYYALSYIDRIQNTWPTTIGLLTSSYSWLLGRGLGGIGTAQLYFEPLNYMAADNFYLYILIAFGVIPTLLLVFVILKGILSLNFENSQIVVLLGVLLSMAATINVVESPEMMILMGMFIGNYISNRGPLRKTM